jgi:signal peptidase I
VVSDRVDAGVALSEHQMTIPDDPMHDAERAAPEALQAPGDPAERRRSTAIDYLEALIIAVVFATFAKVFVVQAFKIPTGSMEDNLLIGDHILVNKFIYGAAPSPVERFLLPHRPIERGDVVVFKYPEDPRRDFIKRCVGLPGDTIELLGNTLRVNGEVVDDLSYVQYAHRGRYRPSFGPVVVPEGEYFCMGDNRDNSRDSRSWGGVPASHVKGRAYIVYWSYDGGRESLEWPGYWGKIRQLAAVARGFFTKTRWGRTFLIVR